MKRRLMYLPSAVVAVAMIGRVTSAQLPVVFDENTYPTNPENTFGAFRFGDFTFPGAFTDGPNSLILDVNDFDGTNGVYGGVGVDYGTPPGTNNHDFDPAFAQWELSVKILKSNVATRIRASYTDQDPGIPVPAEEYVYEFAFTGLSDDGQFHLLTKPLTDELFHQTAIGFDAADDGINNPGLRQVRIESVLGSTGRLNIEIDYIRIVAIPEPASLTLFALAGPAILLATRRRRTALATWLLD